MSPRCGPRCTPAVQAGGAGRRAAQGADEPCSGNVAWHSVNLSARPTHDSDAALPTRSPTPTGDDRALNARRAAILEAVVSEYIGTAEPVGSSHVAHAPGVQVSSATVRSEMVALERDGYLVQPHTSAGRIPTDKGYRFFVDHLTSPGMLGPVQRRQVAQFFAQVHGEMETVLERASGLLSELTSYASVVVGPVARDGHHPLGPARRPLAARTPCFVVVLSDGAVEKRTIDLDGEASDDVLGRAGALLSTHLRRADALGTVDRAGQRVGRGRPPGPGGPRRLRRAGGRHGRDQVFVGGPARSGRVLRRSRDGALGAGDPRAAAGRGDAPTRRARQRPLGGHRHRARLRAAVVVRRRRRAGHRRRAEPRRGRPARPDRAWTTRHALAAAHVVGERLGERIAGGTMAVTDGLGDLYALLGVAA